MAKMHGPPNPHHAAIAQAITLNALRVFKGGGRGLKFAGLVIGKEYERTIKDGYSGSGGGGNVYTHRVLKQKVVSAAPGMPPAMQSGMLRDSVKHRVSKVPSRGAGGKFQKSGAVNVSVFTDIDYAADLEFGAKGAQPRTLWRKVALQKGQDGSITKVVHLHFSANELKAVARMAPFIEVNTLNRRAKTLGSTMGL